MIFVDRSRVAKPKKLDKAMAPALERLEKFFALADKFKTQRRVKFPIGHVAIVKKPLLKLFHHKCAYCERRITAKGVHIDCFRPKLRAMNLDKKTSPEHYWWLVYEWKNLYPVCFTCNRYKATRFPVKGRRAGRGEDVQEEKRLLLDPCESGDEPENALVFHTDGTVSGADQRGKATIELLGLNRRALVRDRRAELRKVVDSSEDLKVLMRIPTAARTAAETKQLRKLAVGIQAHASGRQTFATAKRQLLGISSERSLTETGGGIARFGRAIQRMLAASLSRSTEFEEVRAIEDEQEAAGDSGAIWIERVEIENFKAIKNLTLEFPEPVTPSQKLAALIPSLLDEENAPEEGKEPWIILLGENGTGKSSVLKAVALAFMSPEERTRFVEDASTCVNNEARRGAIRIKFNRGDTALEVTFKKGDPYFRQNFRPPVMPLLAYGATRLPPDRSQTSLTEPQLVRVGNLFEPREPLSDAEHWLTNTDRIAPAVFGVFAKSLRVLLDLDDEAQISRFNKKIRIKVEKRARPVVLRDHSDGYQSVVALTTDIMLNLATDWSDMDSAEGTVLLDEIEAHLHPTWKIEIVSRLRSVFPRVRFIATTHDPLCLHGSRSGEIHRISRDPETRDVLSSQINLGKGLRSDAVLTGAWFGLSTTLDRETLLLMEEHRRLFAAQRLKVADKKRMGLIEALLRVRLDGYAETGVERIALSVAAQILAEEQGLALDQEELRSRTLDGVRAVKQAGET